VVPNIAAAPTSVRGFQKTISERLFPFEVEGAKTLNDLRFRSEARDIGPLQMIRMSVTGAYCGRRRLERPGDARHSFSLLLYEDGGSVSLRAMRSVTVTSGSMLLIDANRRWEMERSGSGGALALSMAAPLLLSRFPQLNRLCQVALDSSEGAAAVLRECLFACWHAHDRVNRASIDGLTTSMIYLLGTVFENAGQREVFDARAAQAHFLRVQSVVLENLEHPDLGVEFVAARLQISKSYLFAVMNAAHTTLGRLILEARLQRCRELLGDVSTLHRSITDIAFAAGFQDLSHFSRRFAARFGMSPRSFRAQARALAGAP
jgi:AraC-like DNA-binding protein